MAGLLTTTGCRLGPHPGEETPRHGDEIIVAGRMFRTGTPVVTWLDPGGYDAYRVNARFKPYDESGWDDIKDDMPAWGSPARYNLRRDRFRAGVPDLTDEEVEQVRGGGWTLEQLQRVVDQFVIHYDVCGTSQYCFEVLHDHRSLSVHFLLDTDGTIYQTLDLQERAWHAGSANSRSIGIEIAHIGAYPPDEPNPLDQWYVKGDDGDVRMAIPAARGKPRTEGFVPRPARDEPIVGTIHGRRLEQYDFTPEQYEALAHLAATLAEVFPNLKLEAPRDDEGRVRTDVLHESELDRHRGLIAHWHLTENKIDPGPAFDWDRVIDRAARLRR